LRLKASLWSLSWNLSFSISRFLFIFTQPSWWNKESAENPRSNDVYIVQIYAFTFCS
jgi:hypothetical protein